MNRLKCALEPRCAHKSGGQVRGWLRLAGLLAAVCLSSLTVADDHFAEDDSADTQEFADSRQFELDAPAPVTVRPRPAIFRPRSIPAAASARPAETFADYAESRRWQEFSMRQISATAESPLLVPLPEPQLPPLPTQIPEPSDDEAAPNLGSELMPAPMAPSPEPLCPDCQPQGEVTSAPDGAIPPGSFLMAMEDDEFGIGSRQVPFALFHIDPVEPLSQIRLRADFVQGLKTPDRAERFWAASPVGPSPPESELNYQAFSVYSETGGDHFSAFTEVPLVFLNPDVHENTTGLGNLIVGQKFLLSDPQNPRWQVAQILRTYLPTGSSRRGLGNGLVSLEPGLLFRYRASHHTYYHGEIKYWIPIGGDPEFAGKVVQYGAGVSRVLWQNDERALLSTLELIGSTIGDGQATLPDGSVRRVNGETFFSILPGVRAALGPSGDLGLLEVGVSGGLTFGDPGWYDSRVLFDVRWSY